MYRILGADQKEYGPATAEQIRQWIKEGRLNPATLARSEGSADWKPLSQFPEFAADLAGGPLRIAPPAFAGTGPGNAEALAEEILARDYSVDVGACISRSWELIKANFWLLVGATFVAHLIQGATSIFLVGPLQGGLFILFLKKIRGEPAEFGDVFAGFSERFLPLFLGGLIMSILTALGVILCVVPGVYLAVAWAFALPLIIEKNLDFWPAMEVSRKVISRHWWQLFLLFVMGFLLMLLGLCACFVGVYVASPVFMGAVAYAYEDIFGKQTPRAPRY
jgi:hypothetical protein